MYHKELSMAAHMCNAIIQEEAKFRRKITNFRLAWAIQWVSSQSGLQSDTTIALQTKLGYVSLAVRELAL